MADRIVIVGGVAGGATAAARLRRNDEQAEIILLERGAYVSFANCGLPYYVGGEIQDRKKLLVQTPASIHARFNVDVRTNSEALSIDRDNKTLRVQKTAGTDVGQVYDLSYDKLVLATGASPARPPIPGVDGKNVYTVWSIPDADRLTELLGGRGAHRIVVMGGGFVGLEMAENLTARGIAVTIVEMTDQVMAPLDRDMAAFVHEELQKNGVTLRLGTKVAGVADTSDGCRVLLEGGDEIEADGVVLSTGVRPNSALARDCGLALGPRGHIRVNQFLQTSDPHIYAVGDAIEVENFVTGEPTAIPLAGPANKQGRIAADNICGANKVYAGTQGVSVAKVFKKTVSSMGLNEKSLLAAGMKLHADYEILASHGANIPAYYPGSSLVHLKVLYNPGNGEILGAQAVGPAGTEKRIDAMAICQRLHAPIQVLPELELAYAPPFNTPKDPVNFIGYMAENLADGLVKLLQWHEVSQLDPAEYQLVDVRKPDEYAQGAIPGSVLVPLNELRERLDAFDPGRKIVVYCKSGVRSYIASRILAQHGFDVYSLNGGYVSYDTATRY